MPESNVATVYRAIVDAIGREFARCDRTDRSGGYRVKANKVFMLVKPLPSKGVVEVKLHVRPGEDLPQHELPFGRESMRGRNTVKHLYVESVDQVPRAMDVARYVHDRTGLDG